MIEPRSSDQQDRPGASPNFTPHQSRERAASRVMLVVVGGVLLFVMAFWAVFERKASNSAQTELGSVPKQTYTVADYFYDRVLQYTYVRPDAGIRIPDRAQAPEWVAPYTDGRSPEEACRIAADIYIGLQNAGNHPFGGERN